MTIAITVAAGACTATSPGLTDRTTQKERDFRPLIEEQAEAILRISPEWATQMGVAIELPGKRIDAILSNYDEKSIASVYQLSDKLREDLNQIDRSRLPAGDQLSYDVLSNAFALAKRQNALRMGHPSILSANPPYAVNQLFGPQVDLPRLLIAQQAVTNESQAEAFLSRLAEFDRVLDELIELTRSNAKRGIVPPSFSLKAMAESAKRFKAPPVSGHPIASAFAEKLSGTTISAKKQSHLNLLARELLRDEVYPAYARFGAALTALIPQAGDGAGVWRLPNGTEVYQVALDAWGANGLSADEVHEIGLNEVARITQEMDSLLRSVGFSEGKVGARMTLLAGKPQHHVGSSDTDKQLLLQSLSEQVDELMLQVPDWFASVPDYPVEIRAIPVHEQDSASGGYYTPPSLDGKRPGVFWVNLKDAASLPHYTLKSLLYHEAVPGHHFQAVKSLAIQDAPLIQNMLWFGDYGEGWALYAEALAKEMGLYDNDPLGDLGRLRMEMYRAARLVVDTGLHHKRWPYAKAVDYMVAVTGESRESIEREIKRYAVWPGQATSYKLGMIQFQRFREKSERALGEQFDIRQFHDLVLRDGAMPMSVLEKRVDAWIATENQKRSQ